MKLIKTQNFEAVKAKLNMLIKSEGYWYESIYQ